MDAGYGGHLVDDGADDFAAADCADADGGESSGVDSGSACGSEADIFDRRKLLIFWQTWMLTSVGILALLTFVGWVSPWTLLAFTFLLNMGSAMNNPAWQAIVPELVPREMIPETVSLNAASNNLARAVGPALGGLMVAAFKTAHTGAGACLR